VGFKLPTFSLQGRTEALKWVALLLMTLDHINKYLFGGASPALLNAGRIAMPLFLTVFAYNLARPEVCGTKKHLHAIRNVGLMAVITTPIFLALGKLLWGWFPLNILFTLFTFSLTIYLLESGKSGWALLVFMVGGALTEFFWPAIGLGVAIWSYYKKPSWGAAAAATVFWLSLGTVNGNQWALSAIVVLAFVAYSGKVIKLPRLKWLFYSYYPLHLAAILFVKNLAK
jgi:hypothetical protein